MLAETMDQSTFGTFRKLIYDKAGINISENKVALVAARVGKRMRELSISEYGDYLLFLQNDRNGVEIVHLLDAISTNVTSFFRENSHFDLFSSLIEHWRDAGQRKFRFWCAASSTGEEPYTMAMVILNKMNNTTADIKILATDISTKVLAKCAEGIYTQDKVLPIPQHMLDAYFKEIATPKGNSFAIRQEVKNLVTFSRCNLSKPPFPMNGPFDAIFCRNVMIYFDNTVRKNLLDEIFRLLRPGGYLFLGHAESLAGITSGFRSVQPSVYLKPQ
jgi:chemotaxis protein methyltransferase CheR